MGTASERATTARLVRDYLSSPVVAVSVDDDVRHAEEIMRQRGVSCLLVRGRDQASVGVLSRTDLLRTSRVRARVAGRHTLLELPAACVADVMTTGVLSIELDRPITEAAERMLARRIHRLFVLDGEAHVGVVSTKELMTAVMHRKLTAPLSEYMSHPVLCLASTEPLSRAVELLEQAGVQGLVVTDGESPAGVFTHLEALEARDLDASHPVEEAMSQAMLCLPVGTPLYRAAGFTVSTRARRVLAIDDRHQATGLMTGLDFGRALIGHPGSPRADAAFAR